MIFIFLKKYAFIFLFFRDDELKPEASLCFLDTLIPIVTHSLAFENGDGFSKMFAQMVRLADHGGPTGHVKLFQASIKLLDTIKDWLKTNIINLEITDSKQTYPSVVIASSCLMNYMSDVIAAMQSSDVENSVSSPSFDNISLYYYDGMVLDGFIPCDEGDSEALNEDSVSILTRISVYNNILLLGCMRVIEPINGYQFCKIKTFL